MTDPLHTNAVDLEREIAWFSSVVDARLALYFDDEPRVDDVLDIEPPDHGNSPSPYARFVNEHELPPCDRLAVMLALLPEIRPQLLDVFFVKNATFDRRFTEFGGDGESPTGHFVPTIQTLAFIVAGNDLGRRFALLRRFDDRQPLRAEGVLDVAAAEVDVTLLKRPIRLTDDYLGHFTVGEAPRPIFGAAFPASRVTTELTWDDLVLHPGTRRQVAEIDTWLTHGETLLTDWDMARKLRPGFRGLFHGPPGTGKTSTACLLGASTGRDVYRIDLAQVVSKYIGETEKNLRKVFDQAQAKDWILFFDEADALFGKRTETTNANDRYANQEVSYLLQRVEMFGGIAILASNRKDNLDEAFARRFEVMVYFPLPAPAERLILWRQAFSPKSTLAPSVDLDALAHAHEFSGGSIMNIVRYASLETLKADSTIITPEVLEEGVRRELTKQGR